MIKMPRRIFASTQYPIVFMYFSGTSSNMKGSGRRLHSSLAGRNTRHNHVGYWAHFAPKGEQSYRTEIKDIFHKIEKERFTGKG
jgi:hypothetical protein